MKKLILFIFVVSFTSCILLPVAKKKETVYLPPPQSSTSEPEYITTQQDKENVINELKIIENRKYDMAMSLSAAASPNYPTIKKVFQVEAYENTDYSRVLTDCPYIVNLCKTKGTIYDNFWAKGHPSQPNYMRNFFNISIFSDNTIFAPLTRGEENLYTALKAKGKAWTNYIDALPSVGYIGSYYGTYAPKHDAGRYANNIDQNVRKPLTHLPTDLNNLSDGVYFICPDMNNSGHDTGPSYADNWTKTNAEMQRIIAYCLNPANHSILCFSWDEGAATNQTFLGIIGGDEVRKNYRTNVGFDTYDFVNMKTDMFGAARINLGVGRTGIMNQWVASYDSIIVPPVDTTSPPVTGTNKTALRRCATLKDGMNYPWMEQYWNGNPNNNYTNYLNMAMLPNVKPQIQLMNVLGFETVRIPVAFMNWGKAGSLTIDSLRYFVALDSICKWAGSLGMNVIIDMHHANLNDSLLASEGNRIASYWKIICNRMKYTNSEKVFFEVYNEPNNITDNNWKNYVNGLLPKLRVIVPSHTFIVGAANYNSLYKLPVMGLVNDTNVIYNFHFYEPYLFTHAGASWAGSDVSTKFLPYPSGSAPMPALSSTATSLFARDQYDKYVRDATYNYLYATVKTATDWAASKNVPLMMNEFGTYKTWLTPVSRCNYTRDGKKIIDALKIPYALWEWSEGFSLFNGVPSITSIDPCLMKAMNITLPTGNICWRNDTTFRDTTYFSGKCVCTERLFTIVPRQVPCPAPLQPSGIAMRFASTPGAKPDNDITTAKLEDLLRLIISNNEK